MELDSIDRFADSLGLDRFRLVGYSGGGFVSLAYAGTRPKRLLSLAIFEPARVPGKPTGEEKAAIHSLHAQLAGLEGGAFMAAFVSAQLGAGRDRAPGCVLRARGPARRPGRAARGAWSGRGGSRSKRWRGR